MLNKDAEILLVEDDRVDIPDVRADPELKSLRIIVLTSSNEPRDRKAAFQNDVDDYIVKPHSFDEFTRAMATILAHWDAD